MTIRELDCKICKRRTTHIYILVNLSRTVRRAFYQCTACDRKIAGGS